MNRTPWMVVVDDDGLIGRAKKLLPEDLMPDLIDAIAELEDNSNFVHRTFHHTKLHLMKGQETPVYIAYVDKISGWRILVQYGEERNEIRLKKLITGEEHDRMANAVKSNKRKFSKRS